jgi:uncharacterized repeat protein (TIGR01451 family)
MSTRRLFRWVLLGVAISTLGMAATALGSKGSSRTAKHGGADLSLRVRSTKSHVKVGDFVTWLIVVRNTGSTTRRVVMTDRLPAGVKIVRAGGAPCRQKGQSAVCFLGGFAGHGVQTWFIPITVQAVCTGAQTDNASVTGSVPDVNPSNNHGSATVHVFGTPSPSCSPSSKPTKPGKGFTG